MSYYEERKEKRYSDTGREEREEKKVPYGSSRIEYAGPAPNTFAGGALGGGLGAVIGFLLAGPAGAAVLGGLGAFIGGFIGAQIDQAIQEQEKQSRSKKNRP